MRWLRQRLKPFVFRLLGKEPEAVIVSVLSGEAGLARAMAEEFRRLVPDRRHYTVALEPAGEHADIVLQPGRALHLYRQLRRRFRRLRIGMAAVLFTPDPAFRPLRLATFLLAPRKILAYNQRLERHHLRLRTWLASWLFLRGIPLDRIFLRPLWLCPWKKDRTVEARSWQAWQGRPPAPGRPRIGVLSPYIPYPLAHGGAVRIFHLLREAARSFDIYLFAFAEDGQTLELEPLLEFCARVTVVAKPRYREPRWSTMTPPEVLEYRSATMRRLLEQTRREERLDLIQVEYTQLASYPGDVLVEHDITFDLYEQLWRRRPTLSAWWDWRRWRRFEQKAYARFRRVVVMSEKDAELAAVPHAEVIPNGVDLERFRPEPEREGAHVLFVGAFRHLPNVLAYRFFTEQAWPRVTEQFPDCRLTVVAGPDPMLYWREATHTAAPPEDPRIRLLGFVRDVRPLYVEANVVVVPTPVSAGTNLKVLEAMAMERAVVSTPAGCAGLGLIHGESVWIAATAEEFAAGVCRLLADPDLRRRLARAARRHAELHFDWRAIGERQSAVWRSLIRREPAVRLLRVQDLEDILRIQAGSPGAAVWSPESYLHHRCFVAELDGRVAGYIVFQRLSEQETEILNLAVDPACRRRGVASALLRAVIERSPGRLWLEVRVSNTAARALYRKFGFVDAGIRQNYYANPPEDGIVMTLASC
ncbi:MAG: ribosomal protein S18-alanine N-acetyltransferase [Bryobacterales bacterium]|nr:ribosomal protein S18-alanine N-acetyltransferase [Bryobacterales bacterium]